jgi:spermidine synthase
VSFIPPSANQRVSNAPAYGVFFASGAASLLCQVVWFKQLQFVLSSSTTAVSIVVATFFAGLAIGGWGAGRLADRWQSPIRMYALTEWLLAIVSLAVTLLLASWQSWVEALAPWLGTASAAQYPIVLAISVLVLLPPTMLMGATLPILSRHLVRHRLQLGEQVGRLYAANTLGASFGCALVGFVLIGAVGVIQSALIASAVYAMIGTASLILFRENSAAHSTPADNSGLPAAATGKSEPTPGFAVAAAGFLPAQARLLQVLVALSGFAAIGYEVLWFRVLSASTFPTVYAFSAMLSTYLLGLVLGAWICARWLAPRRSSHVAMFSQLQILTALGAVVSLAMLGQARLMQAGIGAVLVTAGLGTILPAWLLLVIEFQVTTMLTLLVPATLIGTTFPLAIELTVNRLEGLGRELGWVYALNTAGGVAGSLLCAFVLMPAIGSQAAILVLAGLSLAIGLASTSLDRRGAPDAVAMRRKSWRGAGLVAATAMAAQLVFGADYLRGAQSRYLKAEVLDFRESRDGTFVLLGYDLPPTGPFLQLLANGMSFANTVPHGRRYHAVFGHLPALLHPDPRHVLVICVGTGTTAGSLLLHPEVERLWAVDIASEPFEFAPYFAATNHGLADSPKVERVRADGRHFLLTTQQRFDIITAEPPPPLSAGVVNLYSQEFYQLAKRRLNPGGILVQWFPMNQGSELVNRMNIATLTAEFEHVSLWIPNGKEGVAIASDTALTIDPDRLAERMAVEPLHSDLTSLGLGEVEGLLATFLSADQELADVTGDVPRVTDNRPRIEYHGFYDGPPLRYDMLLEHRSPLDRYLQRPLRNPAGLTTWQRIMEDLWYGSELDDDGHFQQARDRYQHALNLAPTNAFVTYTVRMSDYRRSLREQQPHSN